MTTPNLATVPFHGASLTILPGPTPTETLVAMRPVIEGMDLNWSGQLQRIRRHEVLGTSVCTIHTQMPGDDQTREVICLPLDMLNFWLATVDAGHIPDPAKRARIIEYQKECAKVLFDHFFGKYFPRKRSYEPYQITIEHQEFMCLRDPDMIATESICKFLGVSPFAVHQFYLSRNYLVDALTLERRVEGEAYTFITLESTQYYLDNIKGLSGASANRALKKLKTELVDTFRRQALSDAFEAVRCPTTGRFGLRADVARDYLRLRWLKVTDADVFEHPEHGECWTGVYINKHHDQAPLQCRLVLDFLSEAERNACSLLPVPAPVPAAPPELPERLTALDVPLPLVIHESKVGLPAYAARSYLKRHVWPAPKGYGFTVNDELHYTLEYFCRLEHLAKNNNAKQNLFEFITVMRKQVRALQAEHNLPRHVAP